MTPKIDAVAPPLGADQADLIEEDAKLLASVLSLGCADYQDDDLYSLRARATHPAGTRAHLKTHHVVTRAMELTLEDPRIRFVSQRGRKLFIIGDRAYSLKKLTRDRRPRTSRTRQDRRFLGQIPLIPGLAPDNPNWVAGYIENRFGDTDSLWLILPGPEGNRAEFEITSYVDATTDISAPVKTEDDTQKTAETAETTGRRRRVVRRESPTG